MIQKAPVAFGVYLAMLREFANGTYAIPGKDRSNWRDLLPGERSVLGRELRDAFSFRPGARSGEPKPLVDDLLRGSHSEYESRPLGGVSSSEALALGAWIAPGARIPAKVELEWVIDNARGDASPNEIVAESKVGPFAILHRNGAVAAIAGTNEKVAAHVRFVLPPR